MRPVYASKKRDANEGAIVAALLAVGATVERLDVVDLLVGYCGGNWLLECKTPAGLKRKSKTAERQAKWQREWAGQVHIVTSPEEALRRIGIKVTDPVEWAARFKATGSR